MHQGKSAINRFRWDRRPCCSVPHGVKLPANNWGGHYLDEEVTVGIHLLAVTISDGNWGEGRNRQESTCWAGWFVTAPEGAEQPGDSDLEPSAVNTENSWKMGTHCRMEKGREGFTIRQTSFQKLKKIMELLPKYFSPCLYHIIVNKVTGACKLGV